MREFPVFRDWQEGSTGQQVEESPRERQFGEPVFPYGLGFLIASPPLGLVVFIHAGDRQRFLMVHQPSCKGEAQDR